MSLEPLQFDNQGKKDIDSSLMIISEIKKTIYTITSVEVRVKSFTLPKLVVVVQSSVEASEVYLQTESILHTLKGYTTLRVITR